MNPLYVNTMNPVVRMNRLSSLNRFVLGAVDTSATVSAAMIARPVGWIQNANPAQMAKAVGERHSLLTSLLSKRMHDKNTAINNGLENA